MKEQVTPLPWTAKDGFVIGPDGLIIADCDPTAFKSYKHRRNAAFIVRAVNSHEALVSACESFMEDWRDLKSDYENTPLGHTAKAMQSALALAKGKV